MNLRRYLTWRFWLLLFILPLLTAGLLFGLAAIQEQTRYNPAYFTEEYIARYNRASTLIEDLEQALQSGDSDLMAALQGTRQVPRGMQPRPNIRFSMLISREGLYRNYLFYDIVTFHRYTAHVKETQGRHVVVPENLYYYVDSGFWREVFVPPAVIWWSILLVGTLSIWIYRVLAEIRKKMFG